MPTEPNDVLCSQGRCCLHPDAKVAGACAPTAAGAARRGWAPRPPPTASAAPWWATAPPPCSSTTRRAATSTSSSAVTAMSGASQVSDDRVLGAGSWRDPVHFLNLSDDRPYSTSSFSREGEVKNKGKVLRGKPTF